jgi:hypothetical protein
VHRFNMSVKGGITIICFSTGTLKFFLFFIVPVPLTA